MQEPEAGASGSRAPGVPQPAPTRSAGPAKLPSRRFGDDEISRILHKAAELQERAATLPHESGRGLTLEELRQIALEAGIDPRFVDLAANDAAGPVERKENVFVGGPFRWHYNAVVPGEIGDPERERMVHAVRSITGQKGELADVFGRLEWSYNDGLGSVIVGVSSRDGRTEVDVSAARGSEIGLIQGLGIPFIGMIGGALTLGALGVSGPAAALPLMGMWATAAYLGGRLLWKQRAKWWEGQLERITNRLSTIAQSAPALPPPEESGA